MPSFAKIDENNIVIQTITATYKFIRDGNVGAPSSWLEFSKTDPEKRRFPGIGWIYDPIEDNFFPPKPFPSWVWTKDENLNMEYWAPPIPFPGTPENGWSGRWDEELRQWIEEPPGHFDWDLDRWVPD